MQAEDRIIHYSAELIHQPVQFRKEPLQKLYFDLSQTRAPYDGSDFTNPAQARMFARRGKKTQSIAMFLPDRVLVIEEWADIPLNEFIDKVREVGLRAMEARGIGAYLAHTCTIRSTFALTHHTDSRLFLLDHMMQQAGRISPFLDNRPVAIGGLKLVLPETNEHPGTYHVTIESYRHSLSEVFVELKGVFGQRAIGAGDFNDILNNIRGVRTFIGRNVQAYLNQFDAPPATA